MSVDEVYQLMQYIINKNQSGDLTDSRFGIVINQAQRSYIAFLVGLTAQYQNGRPIPRVGQSNNQSVDSSLAPLLVSMAPITVDSQGYANYPTGYLRWSAMYTTGKKRIRYASNDKLASLLNSAIDPIAENPVYELGPTLKFYPENIGSALFSYYSKPPEIVWGFQTVSMKKVYNPATSVQPVWNDLDMFEIVARALDMVGVNLQAAQVSNFSQRIKAGQE